VGKKTDNDKNRLDLIDSVFINGIGKVLTFGAKKYKPNNWQTLRDPEDRYYGAIMRHLLAWRNGKSFDGESRLSHLLHAATNIMFLYWFERRKKNAKNTSI
jgi:hypothetical protein